MEYTKWVLLRGVEEPTLNNSPQSSTCTLKIKYKCMRVYPIREPSGKRAYRCTGKLGGGAYFSVVARTKKWAIQRWFTKAKEFMYL